MSVVRVEIHATITGPDGPTTSYLLGGGELDRTLKPAEAFRELARLLRKIAVVMEDPDV